MVRFSVERYFQLVFDYHSSYPLLLTSYSSSFNTLIETIILKFGLNFIFRYHVSCMTSKESIVLIPTVDSLESVIASTVVDGED
jgi:hypothetical protein